MIGQSGAEAPRAHQDRGDVDQHAIPERCKEECPEKRRVEELYTGHLLDDEKEKDQSVSGDLDQRAEILEEPEGGEGKPADPAERAASKHRAVIAQRLAQAAVPAAALFPQRLERLRHFGPRDGMRKKGDAAVEALVSDVSVQPHHDLHVLTHRPRSEPDVFLHDPVANERA